MKAKSRTVLLLLLGAVAGGVTGCTEASKVSFNIAKEADNFNVYRRVAIINTRTDKIEFEIIGKMSVEVKDKRLDILVEDEDGAYYKHIVNLTDNNMYVVEDLGGSDVSTYKYEINFLPEMILPLKVTSND